MFNIGFFGQNPPKWWMGQVPLGQSDNKLDPNKWGDRVQVRIMGYHPKDGGVLPDKDLPWAIIQKPTSQGNGNKGSTSIVGGEWVMGFFLDDDCRNPVITGILGKSVPDYSIGVSDQLAQQSTNFKNVNIYNEKNPAARYNYKSGNDGIPKGKKSPLQPPKDLYPNIA